MAERKRTSVEAALASRQISITRIFDAPRRLVFSMWAEGGHMNQWSCPDGFTIPSAAMDFRPGGAWHCHMRSPDGEDHRLQGFYREIVPNERLVFTHVWLDEAGKPGHETLVTVTFADEGKKTRMVFHQGEFDSIESRDGHEGGWTQCFDKLAHYISQHQGD